MAALGAPSLSLCRNTSSCNLHNLSSSSKPLRSSKQVCSAKIVWLTEGRSHKRKSLLRLQKSNRTPVRAEKASKERQGISTGNVRNAELDEEAEGLPKDTSVWDSNAEGVRRGRFKTRSSVWPDSRDVERFQDAQKSFENNEPRSKKRNVFERNRWQESWQFEDMDIPRQPRKKEWDYDAEARTFNGARRRVRRDPQSSGRWQSAEDDDDYFESARPGASDNFKDWFSELVDLDLNDAFVLLRWGLPAAVVLVPWITGNPLILLFGLSFVPAVNKLIVPVFCQMFRAVMSVDSQPRRRKRNTQRSSSSPSSRRKSRRTTGVYGKEKSETSTSVFSSDDEADGALATLFGDLDVDDTKEKDLYLLNRPGPTESVPRRLGGWDDLEDDRVRARMDRWPRNRNNRSDRIVVRREENIFVRLILALFPFLRNWGGLM